MAGVPDVADDLDRQIAALEAQLRRLKRQRADRRDQAFLLALRRVIPPGVPFLCVEVLQHATLHPELASAIGPRDAQQLGLAFARLARRWPETVERLCKSEDGCYWQLRVSV